jgi:hypothetical protein
MEVQKMSKTSIFFDALCDIVDEDVSLLGIKVTRNLKPWLEFSDLPELNGFFANWVFYNALDDEVPYILVMYTSVDGSEDNKFMIIGAKRDSLIDWETGIKMVVNKPELDW